MNTHESIERKKKRHFGATVFLTAFLSACVPQPSTPTPSEAGTTNTSRGGVPGSVAELQARYEAAAAAEELYIQCMERYFPTYRADVETYGSVFTGDPLDDTPHPSVEGCRAERDARNTAARTIGLPPI
ncbi:hypothetical protein K2P56_01435 [Patescibacteria group bacterium]|nr:hypothetical protein [Patescibacteria group bacterium]